MLPIVFAVGMFWALPQALAQGTSSLFHLGLGVRDVGFQLLTAIAKLTILIGWMLIIRRSPYIYRTFQYHGAEHKSIYTYESGKALSVENARQQTTLHPRCGTTFIVMVALVSIVVFSALGPLLPQLGLGKLADNLLFFALKLPFLPLGRGHHIRAAARARQVLHEGPRPNLALAGLPRAKDHHHRAGRRAARGRAVGPARHARTRAKGRPSRSRDGAELRRLRDTDDARRSACGMIPVAKLESIVRRYAELDQLLCDPKVFGDPQKLNSFNRERSGLSQIVEAFQEWRAVEKHVAEDREAMNDPELGPLVKQELPELEAKLEGIEQRLFVLLLPKDSQRRKEHAARNPRRHGRRRSRAVRRRFAAHVHALRRDARLAARAPVQQ